MTADRTEYSTTHANPDGSFTLTQSTTPQRVKEADGGWGGVDPVLERRADGVAPRALWWICRSPAAARVRA
ncbi:hypothetical protein ACFQ3Z_44670 [Streptomyces nogalater]